MRILCQSDSTLHDVVVDGVYDESDTIDGIIGRGLQTIRIGDSDILYSADCGYIDNQLTE